MCKTNIKTMTHIDVMARTAHLVPVDEPRQVSLVGSGGAVEIDCVIHVVLIPHSTDKGNILAVDLC